MGLGTPSWHPATVDLAGGWGILPDLVSETSCDRPVRETEFETEFIFLLYARWLSSSPPPQKSSFAPAGGEAPDTCGI